MPKASRSRAGAQPRQSPISTVTRHNSATATGIDTDATAGMNETERVRHRMMINLTARREAMTKEERDRKYRTDLASCPILRKVVLLGHEAAEDVIERDDETYMFLIKLNGVENPSITRTIAVPATLNFTQFHVALQIAFGWEAGHAWRFEVKSGVEEIDGPHDYLKRGPVRRFPYRCWQEDFLTLSDATVERNGSSHDAIERTAANVKLCDIFKRNPRALQADYAYDFGDGWQHKISFLGAAQPELLRAWKKMYTIPNDTMMCISGEGHPCAEDCGGVNGWAELKELFSKPETPDADGRQAWYQEQCDNGEESGLEPWKWDMKETNMPLFNFWGLIVGVRD